MAYVPPQRPGFPGGPDQGLPGAPDYPDQGLPGEPDYPSQGPGFPGQGLPGWPDYPDQGLPGWPGFPERPGQGLPRPPRPQVPVYPIVEDHELGGHPEADHLDLNQTRRILVTDGQDQYTAYALEPYPPEVGTTMSPATRPRACPEPGSRCSTGTAWSGPGSARLEPLASLATCRASPASASPSSASA